MKRRVRIINRAIDEVGGAEILLAEQAKLLRSLGAEVRLRVLAYRPSAWRERLAGLPVDCCWEVLPGKRAPKLRRSLFDPALGFLLEDLEGADLALSHNFPASSLLGRSRGPKVRLWYCHEPPRWMYPEASNPYTARALGRAPERHGPAYYRRSLASPWGLLPFFGRRRPAHVAADQAGVSALDGVWANSEYTRDNLVSAYGSLDAEVVYPLIDSPPSAGRRSGSSSGGLVVLTLTRLEWIKNLDTLIDGFALFRKKTDPRAELHIVGNGQVRELLRVQVRELGLDGAVTLHGFLPGPELEALFARADVFAFVPLDEPFGMVFPEAMLRGLLVLGPDHGGPLEILDGGRLGEVTDPLDPEAIADGLVRLSALSHAAADERRARAAEAAEQRFSRRTIGERIATLLRRRGLEF